jgi:hypothetical protein
MKKVARLGIVGLALSSAAVVNAEPSDRADRVLRQLDRAERRAPEPPLAFDGAAPDKTSIKFILTLPADWTNNAAYADVDPASDVHFAPSGQFRATKTFKDVELHVRGTASSDIYVEEDTNNLSFFSIRAEARGTRPLVFGAVPYARYEPRVEYSDGEFDTHDRTLHEFTLGARRDAGLGELELFVRRRESNSTSAERTVIGGAFAVERPLKNAQWAISFDAGLQGRFFTGSTNDGREDVYVSSTIAASWTSKNERFSVTPLEVEVEYNQSNRADRDYFVINVGPVLSLVF